MVNDKSKDIIVKIIEYMSKNNILGITYAEAIDENTVAQLNVTIVNDIDTHDAPLPAKRITLFSHTEEDKKLVQDILNFLSEENTVGFKYDMKIPDTDQTIFINVLLKQQKTDDDTEKEES